jgi:hypothetical protein
MDSNLDQKLAAEDFSVQQQIDAYRDTLRATSESMARCRSLEEISHEINVFFAQWYNVLSDLRDAASAHMQALEDERDMNNGN